MAVRWSVPGPIAPLGPLGNVLWFASDAVGRATWLFDHYGSMVSLSCWGGTRTLSPGHAAGTVLVRGAELMRELLTGPDLYKYPLAGRLLPVRPGNARERALQRWEGGLFAVNGEAHKQQRRLVMPAFHRERIGAYQLAMERLTDELLDSWEDGQIVDIQDSMMRLSMVITAKVLFGLDLRLADEARLSEVLFRARSLALDPLVMGLPLDVAP